MPLKTFILRDPKTRRICKSEFRDRIIHHAIIEIIEPIFEKIFIYDSCANRKGKGNLFAKKRLHKFIKKISRNGRNCGWFNSSIMGFCLKADIKHYFQEVNHEVLIKLIEKKISDNDLILLIKKILKNKPEVANSKNCQRKINDFFLDKGMPLGNLTSQFFANVYLNELDYYVKHELKAKYYIRYVDDFILLHSSKKQLSEWLVKINDFLNNHLKLELHPEKSKIIPLSRGIDFVGFRNFYHYTLLRKRNVRSMTSKIEKYKIGETPKQKILESFQGWNAYAMWGNSYKIRKNIVKKIYEEIPSQNT